MALLSWAPEIERDFLRMQARAQRAEYRRRFPDAAADIVLVHEEPAGRIYVDRGGEETRLIDLSLLPEHRGHGIGGRLLADLLAEAAAHGRRVVLQVDRANPARRLYERLGFTLEGDDGVYCAMTWHGPGPPAR